MSANQSPTEDRPKQQRSLNPKLVAAIIHMQPKSAPEGIVPRALPDYLKIKVPSITTEELRSLYNVNKGVSMVTKGSLRAQDLIALHIRSYKSLLGTKDLKESRIRFLRVLSSVFYDILNDLRGKKPISPVSIDHLHTLILHVCICYILNWFI